MSDQEEIVIQVKRFVDKKDVSVSDNKYLVFYCSVIVNGYKKIFDVRYQKDTCQLWLMGIREG